MAKWLLAWCSQSDMNSMKFYLETGWEPFAVCAAVTGRSVIYFRKCEAVPEITQTEWPTRIEVGDPYP